jgi:AcrR family transcriptional regulator
MAFMPRAASQLRNRRSAPSQPTSAAADEQSGTRERILDIAVDLFTTQGYDKTSLRQIAERLGFSKAAIYYHFASKEDILMALHLRLHDFGREALKTIGTGDASIDMWAALMDGLIEQIMKHRPLVLLHERNRAALEQLHIAGHEADHEDLEARFREVLASPAIPVRDRVRMACAFGAVIGGLVLVGDVFSDVPTEELSGMLREAVKELLKPIAAGR